MKGSQVRNQRVIAGRVLSNGFGLVFGLVAGFVAAVAGGVAGKLGLGLGLGLAVGLGVGLASAFAYPATWPASLAFAQLARGRHTPVRLMCFLEDARQHDVLRAVGPVYQFRHARLQDRLAEQANTAMYPEQPAVRTAS